MRALSKQKAHRGRIQSCLQAYERSCTHICTHACSPHDHPVIASACVSMFSQGSQATLVAHCVGCAPRGENDGEVHLVCGRVKALCHIVSIRYSGIHSLFYSRIATAAHRGTRCNDV